MHVIWYNECTLYVPPTRVPKNTYPVCRPDLALVSCRLKLLCLGAHALKAYGSWFVCQSFYMSVTPFLRAHYINYIGARKYSMGIAWQYLELNSLRFLNQNFYSLVMAWFAHLKHCCGVFQTPNLLEVDLLASWHFDQYNSYSYWQRNYTVNMLS